ncbi:hypothetical protein BHYA_0208g00070 [Botrytis hyacinthi]|uniref:Uncharacterized protein n=1 Tax=Botrytis hyacinthi TaxID=278943 RepID=A0A4Z1GDL3_9HELO|nr:hypothetical protein BHYA_0208g00070 [Botrytis hyacinthi]
MSSIFMAEVTHKDIDGVSRLCLGFTSKREYIFVKGAAELRELPSTISICCGNPKSQQSMLRKTIIAVFQFRKRSIFENRD